MPYHSIDEILRRCRDRACPFWQVVLTTQAKETQLPESAVLDQMDQMAKAMEDSIIQYDPTAVTTGKMCGQNGARLAEYNQKGDTLLGDYLSAVIAAAVQVAVRPDVLHHQPGGAQAFREGVQNVVTHSRTSC